VHGMLQYVQKLGDNGFLRGYALCHVVKGNKEFVGWHSRDFPITLDEICNEWLLYTLSPSVSHVDDILVSQAGSRFSSIDSLRFVH
jgi:hypothetical protein